MESSDDRKRYESGDKMSQLGWVDFSSTDRELVSKVLAMLREPGTLDELGIGQIRDAFADQLFPGFSTIQTRAKYLITVPRIFRDYHHLHSTGKNRKKLSDYLKEQENEVAKHLVAKHGNSEDGIIGSTMVEKGGVARRPSSVYWNAFRQFGIIKETTSLSEFCHQYAKEASLGTHQAVENDDGIDDDGHYRLKNKVEIPSYDSDWLKNLSLDLTPEEAEFLYLYIMQSRYIANSIPAQLFKHSLLDIALETQYQSIDALTTLIINDKNISSSCKEMLRVANEFSLAMEGPHIRYNYLLAQKNGFKSSIEKYEKEYASWNNEVIQKNIYYADCAEIWLAAAAQKHPRPFKSKTVNFIKEWSQLIQNNASLTELDRLVEDQAKKNKGPRSLLYKKLLNEGWIGIRRMDYRWSSAIKILNDIKKGLQSARS